MAGDTGKIWFDFDTETAVGGAAGVESESRRSSSGGRCCVCELDDASFMCRECGTKTCKDCFDAVHSNPARQSHTLIPLGGSSQGGRTALSCLADSRTTAQAKAAAAGICKDIHLQAGTQHEVQVDDSAKKRALRAAAKRADFLRSQVGEKTTLQSPVGSDFKSKSSFTCNNNNNNNNTKSNDFFGRVSSAGSSRQMSRGLGVVQSPRDEKQVRMIVKDMLLAARMMQDLGDVAEARKLCMAAARAGMADWESMGMCADFLSGNHPAFRERL